MKIGKVHLALFGAHLILSASCNSKNQETESSIVFNKDGIYFEYPESWSVVDHKNIGGISIYARIKSSGLHGIDVWVFGKGEYESLLSYAKDRAQTMRSALPNEEITISKFRSSSTNPTNELFEEYSILNLGIYDQMKVKYIYRDLGEKDCFLRYESSLSEFQDGLFAADIIASSFKLNNPNKSSYSTPGSEASLRK